jgi:hypothetical protein
MVEVGLYFKDVLMAVRISTEIGRPTNTVLENLSAIFGLEMSTFID